MDKVMRDTFGFIQSEAERAGGAVLSAEVNGEGVVTFTANGDGFEMPTVDLKNQQQVAAVLSCLQGLPAGTDYGLVTLHLSTAVLMPYLSQNDS